MSKRGRAVIAWREVNRQFGSDFRNVINVHSMRLRKSERCVFTQGGDFSLVLKILKEKPTGVKGCGGRLGECVVQRALLPTCRLASERVAFAVDSFPMHQSSGVTKPTDTRVPQIFSFLSRFLPRSSSSDDRQAFLIHRNSRSYPC